jgi:hypothetical protein
VKSKMHKFNSRNARIPGSPWQTPKEKKKVHKLINKKQLKRVDAIKEMCLITFHSLHSWWQKNWFFHNILMNDRFLHFGCFSVVIGSLKPSDSFFFFYQYQQLPVLFDVFHDDF